MTAQSAWGSRPEAVGEQTPEVPPLRAAKQDMHSPSQGVSQQTPSTQLPEAQVSQVLHTVPLGSPAKQAPAPLQVRGVAQAVSAHSSSGSWPLGMGEQKPEGWLVRDWLQAMHSPVQAASQQTPSTQNPREHWVASVQGRPRETSRRQAPRSQYQPSAQGSPLAQDAAYGMHAPSMQASNPAQSATVSHTK
jgi:hypothetical protein